MRCPSRPSAAAGAPRRRDLRPVPMDRGCFVAGSPGGKSHAGLRLTAEAERPPLARVYGPGASEFRPPFGARLVTPRPQGPPSPTRKRNDRFALFGGRGCRGVCARSERAGIDYFRPEPARTALPPLPLAGEGWGGRVQAAAAGDDRVQAGATTRAIVQVGPLPRPPPLRGRGNAPLPPSADALGAR